MFITLWTFNNIIAHRLLTACCGVPSDSYRYQVTNKFENILDLEYVKNTLMIITPILLVLYIHIALTRLLEDGIPNADFDVKERFCPESNGLD